MALNKRLMALVSTVIAATAVALAPSAQAAPAQYNVSWGGEAPIPGVGGSSDAPALAVCYGPDDPYLGSYMLWKGVGNDQRLFLDKFNLSGQWGNQQLLPFGGTSTAPSLACGPGGMLMAVWKGVAGDERMFWSTSSDGGLTWTPQAVVTDLSGNPALTDMTPTVTWAHYGGYPQVDFPPELVWRGAGGDEQIYNADWDSAAGGFWSGGQPVPGAFTDTPPRVSYDLDDASVLSYGVVWKGTGSDPHFWYQHRSDNSAWNPQPAVIVADGGTSTTPDVSDGGQAGRPLMAWKGTGNDQRIFFASAVGGCYDLTQPQCWYPQQLVPSVGGTSGGPGVGQLNLERSDGSFDDVVLLVWKGVPGDQRLFYSVGQLPN